VLPFDLQKRTIPLKRSAPEAVKRSCRFLDLSQHPARALNVIGRHAATDTLRRVQFSSDIAKKGISYCERWAEQRARPAGRLTRAKVNDTIKPLRLIPICVRKNHERVYWLFCLFSPLTVRLATLSSDSRLLGNVRNSRT
jgi:hypothetical protein